MIDVRPFFMIRHGETVANAEGFTAGAVETPLTPKGWEQAQKARLCFEALPQKPSRIVHSALSRARNTAQVMNESLGLPMAQIAGFGEHDFGAWAGLPWSEAGPKIIRGETPPGGESAALFDQRIQKAFIEAFAAFNETLLVVAHGGVFHALARLYGCKIVDVQNCELYGFFPGGAGPFPWAVRHYFLDEQGALTDCPEPVLPKSQ